MGRFTRITIETDRILVVARQRGIRLWCVRCGSEVEFVTFDDPAPLVARGAKVIETPAATGQGWRSKLGKSVMRFLRDGVIG